MYSVHDEETSTARSRARTNLPRNLYDLGRSVMSWQTRCIVNGGCLECQDHRVLGQAIMVSNAKKTKAHSSKSSRIVNNRFMASFVSPTVSLVGMTLSSGGRGGNGGRINPCSVGGRRSIAEGDTPAGSRRDSLWDPVGVLARSASETRGAVPFDILRRGLGPCSFRYTPKIWNRQKMNSK